MENLENQAPLVADYLRSHEGALRERALFRRYFQREKASGSTVETGPFHSMFNVNSETLSPIKVVWPRMGARLEAAVIDSGDGTPILPQETLCFIATSHGLEAHYLAALINSAPFQLAARACGQVGGKSFGTPHLFEVLRLPAYDQSDDAHKALAHLSRKAHAPDASPELQREMDTLALGVWEMDGDALEVMYRERHGSDTLTP